MCMKNSCSASRSTGDTSATRTSAMPPRKLAKIGGWLTIDRPNHPPPLEDDLRGLAPVLIQVGSIEMLLSDAELLAGRLEASGVNYRLQVWQNQVHVFQALADIVPEARMAIAEAGAFVQTHLTTQQEARHA